MSVSRFIWSVGGGRGGAGKSVVAANLGCALAMAGRSVALIDADSSGAGLHACFGMGRPSGSEGLADLACGRLERLEDLAVETGVDGLRLVSGAGEFLGSANPSYRQKQAIIDAIRDIDADCVIVDIGAGSSYNALDFFAVSKTGVIVFRPGADLARNAYIFLKNFVYRLLFRLFAGDERLIGVLKEATDARRADSVKSVASLLDRLASVDVEAAARAASEITSYRPRLLLNMASSEDDLSSLDLFRSAAGQYLGVEAEPVGVLHSSPSVEAACRAGRPFMLEPEAAAAQQEISAVAAALLASFDAGARAAGQPLAGAEAAAGRKPFGFNENVEHNGMVYHVQTEAHGGLDPVVETIVYNEGRVFFSKRVVCREEESGGNVREFAQRQHRAAMAAIKMDKINPAG